MSSQGHRGDDVAAVFAAFASLPADTILKCYDVAELIGRSERTVERMVEAGQLPPPVTFMRRRIWQAGTICAYIRCLIRGAAEQALARNFGIEANIGPWEVTHREKTGTHEPGNESPSFTEGGPA